MRLSKQIQGIDKQNQSCDFVMDLIGGKEEQKKLAAGERERSRCQLARGCRWCFKGHGVF